jgi:hypothetical protein
LGNASSSKDFLVVLWLIEPHDCFHAELPEQVHIVVGTELAEPLVVGVLAVAQVDRATEGDELAWNNMVQICIEGVVKVDILVDGDFAPQAGPGFVTRPPANNSSLQALPAIHQCESEVWVCICYIAIWLYHGFVKPGESRHDFFRPHLEF